jgi:hypothetical protein
MSEEDRAKAAASRKLVIENNKAWAATQPVRRDWLATFRGYVHDMVEGDIRFSQRYGVEV